MQPHIGTAVSKGEEERNTKNDGADLVHSKDGLTVHKLKTHEAACLYGAGTRWCTASKNSDYHFKQYSTQGPLYVVQTPDSKKFQFHFATNQFANEEDRMQKIEGLVDKYPQLKEVKEFQNISPLFDTDEGVREKVRTGKMYGNSYMKNANPIRTDIDNKTFKLTAEDLHHAAQHIEKGPTIPDHEKADEHVKSNLRTSWQSSILDHPNLSANDIHDIYTKHKIFNPIHKNLADDTLSDIVSNPEHNSNSFSEVLNRSNLRRDHIEKIHNWAFNPVTQAHYSTDTETYAILRHKNTPTKVLSDYYEKGNEFQKNYSLMHPNISPQHILDAVKHPKYLSAISVNPKTPVHILEAMESGVVEGHRVGEHIEDNASAILDKLKKKKT